MTERRRRSRGFTLIELLIIMIILAILAGIVIPRFFSTKERALVATLQSDLRNLITAQVAYWDENQVYASDVSDLLGVFAPSAGVAITIDSATATGWGATATHASASKACEVSVSRSGAVAPVCVTP